LSSGIIPALNTDPPNAKELAHNEYADSDCFNLIISDFWETDILGGVSLLERITLGTEYYFQ
jgi:hypothetical protein